MTSFSALPVHPLAFSNEIVSNKDQPPNDWKLKLRYGKLKTPYKHFTVFAEGCMEEESSVFECPLVPAWMAIKIWATDSHESNDMIQAIGRQVEFTVTGRIEIYITEPIEPPDYEPFGYYISFHHLPIKINKPEKDLYQIPKACDFLHGEV